MKLVRSRAKQHGCRTIAFLFLAGALGCWVLAQLAPASGTDPARVMPKGTRFLDGFLGPAHTADDTDVVASQPEHPLRLLLATHNRLFWFCPGTGEETAVHSGQVRRRRGLSLLAVAQAP